MRLIEQRGGFLYQHRPDVVGTGYLSDDEVALWAAYYEMRRRERGNG